MYLLALDKCVNIVYVWNSMHYVRNYCNIPVYVEITFDTALGKTPDGNDRKGMAMLYLMIKCNEIRQNDRC